MQVNDFHPGDLFGQIQNLVEQLEKEREARALAELAGAAASGLLSIVGKELQPPLETAAVMADRILAGPLSAKQRHEAEALAQSTRLLLGALTDVVDFSDLESGEAELSLERFDLHAVVKHIASVLQQRASAKGVMSGVDLCATCPRFIVGDEMRVRQVLMGLVESALQSTSEGSIRLFVSVNDSTYPMTVRFDISDTGTGLSPAQRAALFQPAADEARVGGRLGLPIARRLAEAMGGGVGCDSAVGQGSLYWFTFQTVVADDVTDENDGMAVLEAANDDAPVEEPKAAMTSKPSPKGALSGHVLVIEGNAVNRLLIGAYLEEFGLTYEVAETGTAALMCLAARSYDLVLMDTALPDYDGLQMARRIRAMQAPAAEAPVVAVAAASGKDDGRALVEAGVNARVAKPIQGRALYAALVPFLPAQDEVMVSLAS